MPFSNEGSGKNAKETQTPLGLLESTYQPPSTGVLSLFSDRWRPYAELARLDKPGFALLWIVHVVGILTAAVAHQLPVYEVLTLIAWFLLPCQVLMWFNFAWNDTCDFEFDRKVLRTRQRPLARKAMTLWQALIEDAVFSALLLWFLVPLPRTSATYALPLALGCIVYPLTKRWTNYPQVFFAVVLAGGVYMGAAAAGVNGLPYPARVQDVLTPSVWIAPSSKVATAALAASCASIAVWSLETEIVYSYQDADSDEAAGVGTITRVIPDVGSAKALLILLAGAQVAFYYLTGMFLGCNSPYGWLATALTAITMALSISSVNLEDPDSCLFWFGIGNIITGLAMIAGYASEWFLRVS